MIGARIVRTAKQMERKPVLEVERCIASAHRSLHYAVRWASELADLGLHDDLQLIQLELERLQVDLLKGAGRRRKALSDRAYLYSAPRDDGGPST